MNNAIKFVFRKSHNWHWSVELLKWAIVGMATTILIALTSSSAV